MAERDFFTLRYALPGYTFILIIVLIAYPRLIELFPFSSESTLDLTLVAAFVAFFTLLGGGAIGFLVSQFWYVLHNNILHGRYLGKTRELLRNKFKIKEDVHREIVFLDYIFHLSDDTITKYIQRRFDIKHTLGSTLVAILFGSFFGVAVKSNFFSHETSWENTLKTISINLPDFTMYDIAVIIVIGLLSLIILIGFLFINNEHSLMVDVAVKKVLKAKEGKKELHVRDYFSDDYFIADQNRNSQNKQ